MLSVRSLRFSLSRLETRADTRRAQRRVPLLVSLTSGDTSLSFAAFRFRRARPFVYARALVAVAPPGGSAFDFISESKFELELELEPEPELEFDFDFECDVEGASKVTAKGDFAQGSHDGLEPPVLPCSDATSASPVAAGGVTVATPADVSPSPPSSSSCFCAPKDVSPCVASSRASMTTGAASGDAMWAAGVLPLAVVEAEPLAIWAGDSVAASSWGDTAAWPS